jgi:hypothetical protein
VESARERSANFSWNALPKLKARRAPGTVPVVLPTPMAVIQGVRLAPMARAMKKVGATCCLSMSAARRLTFILSVTVIRRREHHRPGIGRTYAKRTVEGDLGIRFNAATIVARVGLDKLTEDLRRDFRSVAVESEQLGAYIELIGNETAPCRKSRGILPLTRCWRVRRSIWRWTATSVGVKESSPARAKHGCIRARTCATLTR